MLNSNVFTRTGCLLKAALFLKGFTFAEDEKISEDFSELKVLPKTTFEQTDKSVPETDQQFVLFRINVLKVKPMLQQSNLNKRPQNFGRIKELPLNLQREQFKKWLQLICNRKNDIQFSII
jgi:hypothetical protein